MADEERDKVLRRLRRIATARDDEAAAVLAATDLGVPQQDIAKALDKPREHVRRVVRKARPWTARKESASHGDTAAD